MDSGQTGSCSAERKARSEKRCSCHSARLSHIISTQMSINWLKIIRKTRERLTTMNDL